MTTEFKDFTDQLHDSEPRGGSAMDRMPPQDNDAEQAVLGSMLTSKDAIADVLETVKAADFYHPAHEYIFSAILDLYGRGEPADPITVANELNRTGMLQRARSPLYLHDLFAKVSVAANAGYYARIVREKAILRRLVEASLKIAQLGYAGEGDVADIVDRAQAAVYSVTDGNTAEDYQPLSELLEATLDEMEAISSRSGEMAGVPTGFIELDELTNGLHGGQMVILAARPAVGKALALDTPLPTPTGWTTMGEVEVGDELLGADGRPTRVVAATEVMQDRECYEICFSDGTTVVADGNHQWVATSRAVGVGHEFRQVLHAVAHEVGVASRVARLTSGSEREHLRSTPAYGRRTILRAAAGRAAAPEGGWPAVSHPRVVTTAEMAEVVTLADGRANWSVPLAKPLALADRDLPLPPYALGVWLGDGHSRGARCTSADREVDNLVRAPGVGVRCQPSRDYGWGNTKDRHFQRTLRQLGLWGHKHIPHDYLRASHSQRLDLLRGLLDADGTVTSGCSVQLAFTHRELAMDARELIHSLGMRCTVTTKTVAGRTTESSTCYTLTFTTDDEVFILPRKQATHRERRRSHTWVTGRHVRSIKPVPSVPVRCVEVDNRDHLYLASEAMIPTHNSTLGLDFARACSIKNGLTSAIFSLEMSKVEITMRLLSAEAQIPLNHIRKGTMSEEDWQRVANKMATISSAPLYIDDSPNLTMMEIRAKARRLKQKHDLKLIIIDYLQLMTSGKKVESRQLEVSEFSRQIKLLAKELHVPVVAMSQLNRGPEQRTDKKPMVSDLRESGCLTADTRILRADTGAEITIGELCRTGQRNIPVWSLDEHHRFVPAIMTHAFSSGTKKVFRMRLASGREIKATANHPFLTLGGWKPLGELTVGSRVATPRRLADPAAAQLGQHAPSRPRPARAVSVLEDPAVAGIATSDVAWDTVVGFEAVGDHEVFDATVPGPHNFIADGIVVHNSLEQDADIVILLHREDIYDKESPRLGEADFIVAKNRNGPTRTVVTAFQGHYSRFVDMQH